jgi:hypothetical protein
VEGKKMDAIILIIDSMGEGGEDHKIGTRNEQRTERFSISCTMKPAN